MDPFTLCLLLAFGVMKMIRTVKVDAPLAKQGIVPPSNPLVQAWLDRRKARGQAPANAAPAPYGARDYFKQLWHALWEDLGQKHAAGRTARTSTTDGAAGAKKPGWFARLLDAARTGWQWVITPVGEVRSGDRTPPDGGQPTPEPTPVAPPAPASPADSTTGPAGATPDTPAVAAPTPEIGDAGDTPAGPPTRTTEGEPVSTQTQPLQQSGEVTGIRSAIHYLTAMGKAHAQHADNEALVARLGDMQVGPGDLGKVQAAMAASAAAAEMYNTAADMLARNNQGVAEAYASGPDAADKQAQMAE